MNKKLKYMLNSTLLLGILAVPFVSTSQTSASTVSSYISLKKAYGDVTATIKQGASVSIPNIDLNAENELVTREVSLPTIEIYDSRGTVQGYKVNVSAGKLKDSAGRVLNSSELSLNTTGKTIPSKLGTDVLGKANNIITGGSILAYEAPKGAGGGRVNIDSTKGKMNLSLNKTEMRAGTDYKSTITYSIVPNVNVGDIRPEVEHSPVVATAKMKYDSSSSSNLHQSNNKYYGASSDSDSNKLYEYLRIMSNASGHINQSHAKAMLDNIYYTKLDTRYNDNYNSVAVLNGKGGELTVNFGSSDDTYLPHRYYIGNLEKILTTKEGMVAMGPLTTRFHDDTIELTLRTQKPNTSTKLKKIYVRGTDNSRLPLTLNIPESEQLITNNARTISLGKIRPDIQANIVRAQVLDEIYEDYETTTANLTNYNDPNKKLTNQQISLGDFKTIEYFTEPMELVLVFEDGGEETIKLTFKKAIHIAGFRV